MKTYVSILAAAAGMLGLATAANAQDAPPMAAPNAGGAYNDTACGTWQGDQWQSNGACATTNYKHAVVAGTITIVKGHLVTLQQTNGTIVIDDSAALNNGTTGRVAVGRQIVAHGYWNGNNFYATTITGGQPPPP